MKRRKKIFHPNSNQKTAGVFIHILDKIDFKSNIVQRDKEGHYVIIKGYAQPKEGQQTIKKQKAARIARKSNCMEVCMELKKKHSPRFVGGAVTDSQW